MRAARETGRGQHVDLSLHETMTSSIENLFFQWWFPDLLPIPQRALRQGSLHWLGAYVVANAKTGACNIAPGAPADARCSSGWPRRAIPRAPSWSKMTIEEALAEMPRVMNAIKRFACTKDSGELFHEAQRRHIAFGEVQTVAQVAGNPQYEFREHVPRRRGRSSGVRLPGPFARFLGTPVAAAAAARRPRRPSSTSRWSPSGGARTRRRPPRGPASTHGPTSAGKPLDGVRIVDFTLGAGRPVRQPRILGDLGADVLKFQTAERATLVNSPDFPYFYVWNRSKRLVSLRHEAAGGASPSSGRWSSSPTC